MRIKEIWRYPVKSMLGEQLDQADVGPGGIAGDRQWAVVDTNSGVSLSAKRYADLLRCRAWTTDGEVMIGMPDGSEWPAGSEEVASGLSDLLGREIVTRSAAATETVQHEFPTAVTEGDGEPFLWEPGTDAFFDSATLHLITTATLSELQRLQPDCVVHPARFRPNFLIDSDEAGFVENDWVSKDVMLGSLRCRAVDPTKRCVMVTRAQEELPQDRELIRTIYEHNDGHAGVALQMQESGVLQCGSPVVVLD